MGIVSNTPEPSAAGADWGTDKRGGDIVPVGTSPNWGGDPMTNTIKSDYAPSQIVVGPSGDPNIAAIPTK
jgi:hypothetical protein